MGSKSDAFETSFLNHVFTNAAIANIGNSAGLPAAGAAGSLYIALCTSATASTDATAGTVTTYGSYARQAVARTSGGWTVSGNQASNAAAIVFPTASSGTETIRYFEVYTALAGGDRLFWGQLTSDLAVSTGIAPQFAIGALTVTED